MVPRWLFLATFASCVFSEPRAAGFIPASQIRTKATPCVEVWQTSNVRRLRLGQERKKNKEEEQTTAWKYNGLSYVAAYAAKTYMYPSEGTTNRRRWTHGRDECKPVRQYLYVFRAMLYNQICTSFPIKRIKPFSVFYILQNVHTKWLINNSSQITVVLHQLPITGSRRHGPGAWLYVRSKGWRNCLQW